MTESVHSLWVSTMHQCAGVHLALSSLTGLHQTAQEHVDVSVARATRDCTDMDKLLQWLDGHNPFQMSDDSLYSLSSGVVASAEVTSDTSDNAKEIGAAVNLHMDSVGFYDIVPKCSSRIKTIEQLESIHAPKPVASAASLFHSLLILVQRSPDIPSHFKYELTAVPTALFQDNFMRKPDKPATLKNVLKDVHCESKKGTTLTMAITLSILDRFAKFFHCCKEQ